MDAPRPGDERLRFRVWIAGKLVDECWLGDSAEAAAAAARQGNLVANAAALGRPWLVEVYDPARPELFAYTRWGTDTGAMTDPQPVPGGDLGRALGLDDGEGAGRA